MLEVLLRNLATSIPRTLEEGKFDFESKGKINLSRMASETIYEAIGEVTPFPSGNEPTLFNETRAGQQENVSNVQLVFTQGATDEAVVQSLFNQCDTEKSGLVRASVLVDFLFETCGSHDTREAFQDLLIFLDPTVDDPLVDIETFQSGLKAWVSDLIAQAENTDFRLDLSSLKFQFDQAPKAVPEESSLLPGSPGLDLKELQYQNIRLQEENKILQDQMADVEEINSVLKIENCKLKTRMNKFELEVTDLGQQSKVLQEDNSQLQNRLLQLKDDMQKMTMQYHECQAELDRKIRELDGLQLSTALEKERSLHLIETIRQLEALIISKEEEIAVKDKEIQRATQNLLDQLSVDSVLTHEFDRRGHEMGDNNLASELQSSFGTEHSWRKRSDNLVKPDFFHPAVWNVMLNEPEYEDEPSVSPSYGKQEPFPAREFEEVIRQADLIVNASSPLPTERSTAPTHQEPQCELAHSTPVRSPVNWNKMEEASIQQKPVADLLQSMKQILWMLSIVALMCIIVCVVAATFLLVLLSATSESDCSGTSSFYYAVSSDYYPPSLWSKVIDFFQPFCRIEYHGYPPV